MDDLELECEKMDDLKCKRLLKREINNLKSYSKRLNPNDPERITESLLDAIEESLREAQGLMEWFDENCEGSIGRIPG